MPWTLIEMLGETENCWDVVLVIVALVDQRLPVKQALPWKWPWTGQLRRARGLPTAGQREQTGRQRQHPVARYRRRAFATQAAL